METSSVIVSIIAIVGIVLVLIFLLRFVPLVDYGAHLGRARAHQHAGGHAFSPRQSLQDCAADDQGYQGRSGHQHERVGGASDGRR